MPGILFLQVEIGRVHEKQSQALRDVLKQNFPGIDEVLEWIFEGGEGQVESTGGG